METINLRSRKVNLLIKTCYMFIVCCGISTVVAAVPAQGATGKSQEKLNNLPKPLYYDIIDNTDVLAIPSDSSGWEQEEELENFEEQSEKSEHKGQQAKHL